MTALGTSTRRRRRARPTDLEREIVRLTANVAQALGREVRRGRLQRKFTQAQLGALVGVHQSWISDIELGRGRAAPLELWVALGIALGRPLAVSFSKGLDPAATLADAGHLEIQEHILGLARRNGLTGTFELPTRPADPSRSTDVGLRDARRQLRILVECWNTIGDLGAATRATNCKLAEAAATWPEDRIATVWVVRASAANRTLLARYPEILATTFRGSSRAWVRALESTSEPPRDPGLVWFDPARARITESRRVGA